MQCPSRLAQATGGAFIEWDDRSDLFEGVPFKPLEVELVDEYPIWNRWWWLIILMGLFCFEWWWRRRLDLV